MEKQYNSFKLIGQKAFDANHRYWGCDDFNVFYSEEYNLWLGASEKRLLIVLSNDENFMGNDRMMYVDNKEQLDEKLSEWSADKKYFEYYFNVNEITPTKEYMKMLSIDTFAVENTDDILKYKEIEILRADTENLNGFIYQKKALEELAKNSNGKKIPLLSKPYYDEHFPDPDLKDIMGFVENFKVVDNSLYGELSIYKDSLKDIIRLKKLPIYLSLACTCEIEENKVVKINGIQNFYFTLNPTSKWRKPFQTTPSKDKTN